MWGTGQGSSRGRWGLQETRLLPGEAGTPWASQGRWSPEADPGRPGRCCPLSILSITAAPFLGRLAVPGPSPALCRLPRALRGLSEEGPCALRSTGAGAEGQDHPAGRVRCGRGASSGRKDPGRPRSPPWHWGAAWGPAGSQGSGRSGGFVLPFTSASISFSHFFLLQLTSNIVLY